MFTFNPYAIGAAAILLLSLFGTIYYQSTQIHHWHKEFNDEFQYAASLKQHIVDMTTAQNGQTGKTQVVVTKIVKGPETIKTLVKEIHDAPVPANCKTPDFPQDVKDNY